MHEYSQSWRKRLRLQLLVGIARHDLESGCEFDIISSKLDKEMQARWKMVPSTRKNYLNIIKKILDNQLVLHPQLSYA